MNRSPRRVSANSSNQWARARCFVEIVANHRRIADREVAVDQNWNAAQRAQALEFFIAEERRDRIDLIAESLQVHRGEHFANVGAHEAADNDQRTIHQAAMARRSRGRKRR
jgi:hypothetical protein